MFFRLFFFLLFFKANIMRRPQTKLYCSKSDKKKNQKNKQKKQTLCTLPKAVHVAFCLNKFKKKNKKKLKVRPELRLPHPERGVPSVYIQFILSFLQQIKILFFFSTGNFFVHAQKEVNHKCGVYHFILLSNLFFLRSWQKNLSCFILGDSKKEILKKGTTSNNLYFPLFYYYFFLSPLFPMPPLFSHDLRNPLLLPPQKHRLRFFRPRRRRNRRRLSSAIARESTFFFLYLQKNTNKQKL